MAELTLKSDKANFYSNIFRVVLGIWGILMFYDGITEMLPHWNVTALGVLNSAVGLGIIIAAITKTSIESDIEINITDETLRTTEDAMTRTAYWHKLDKLTLTKFGLRITYESGTKERFRLPYLTADEFKNLKTTLTEQSESYDFDIEEKAW
ncbi:hypothetical protein [Fodinibius halophilus]|uniref:YcxB family protein n=1 Tax=Fodinibius halophilus TaxID=1736908 RepID=A0A6M1TLW6_9BACT|nr:hypothetical protein [Fodinibius halophilus]NGP89430.1 hypothetical protein [Fodinibius halophilus]